MVTYKEELALKIKLEQRLKPKIKRLLRQIGEETIVVWQATGRTPNMVIYHDEIVSLLREHYRAVNKAFRPVVTDRFKSGRFDLELKQVFEQLPQDEEDSSSIAAALLFLTALNKANSDFVGYSNSHSEQQATHILNTTTKDINKILDTQTIRMSIEDTSRADAAKEARKKFFGDINDRVDTIAVTETQGPAEESKLLHVLALTYLLTPSGEAQVRPVKTWRTIIDNVTRPSHVAADGQERYVDEPFLVGGQQLRVPGDTALGATAENIIHCRCSAEYVLD